jgi:hypothetical protein
VGVQELVTVQTPLHKQNITAASPDVQPPSNRLSQGQEDAQDEVGPPITSPPPGIITVHHLQPLSPSQPLLAVYVEQAAPRTLTAPKSIKNTTTGTRIFLPQSLSINYHLHFFKYNTLFVKHNTNYSYHNRKSRDI